jgi:phytoene synthase
MPGLRIPRRHAKSAAGNEPVAAPRRDAATVLAASTFSAGLMLLPPRLQQDARRLYQLLRTIDDLVDEHHPEAPYRVHAVEQWANGQPADTPETGILEALCQSYPIPREAVYEFCQGMRHDLEGSQIETEADFERYCQQAGGTVGIMICALLGTRHPETEQKMATLGTAMQWTNILRDIDEDLANGRVYVARNTIDRFGFPHPGNREQLLRDQIPRTDALYTEGLTAIPLLEHGQRAMGISAVLYREILRQIERDGYGRNPGRASVPQGRKQRLIDAYREPKPTARIPRPLFPEC